MGFHEMWYVIFILSATSIAEVLYRKYAGAFDARFPIAEKIFGKEETWMNLAFFSLFSGVVGTPFFGFFFPFTLGVVWKLSKCVNSFIKRRIGIPSGGHLHGILSLVQYITDTLDGILGVVIFLGIGYSVTLRDGLFLITILMTVLIILDIFSYSSGFKKLDFPNPLVIFFQILVTIIFRPLHYYHGMWKMNHIHYGRKGNIFICNHIDKVDAFLITTGIDWKSTWKFLPFRFMIANSYMRRKVIGFLLILVGGYRSHHYDKDGKNQSLIVSKQFLERGESVVIFPEGGIKDTEIKVGAFYLNKSFPGSLLQLFHLRKIGNKFRVLYLGYDTIENYPEKNDLLKTGKYIFKKILKHDII